MIELDADRQKLLAKKFGSLLDWKAPTIQQTIGPFGPSAFREFDEARRDLILRCQEHLSRFTDEQIRALQTSTASQHVQLQRMWRTYVDVEIDKLKDRAPPWYAGGFGHPDYRADINHWSKASYYSIPEIASLSVGIEPGYFEGPRLEKLIHENAQKLHPVLRFFMGRFDLIKRQFDPHQYGSKVTPSEFLSWAEQFEVDVPREFFDRLRRLHQADAGAIADTPKKPDKREIDKIAQLFTAMAIDHLGYQPGDLRSPVPKEIVEIAATMGLEVSSETVLKYLRIGAQFIPNEWSPPGR